MEPMEIIKAYIIEQFLPGESPEALAPDTPLLSSGILDSVSVLKLVMYLKDEYKVEIAAHEVTHDHFETLADIVSLVQGKIEG